MNIMMENALYLIRTVTDQDKDEYMRVHQENSDLSGAYDIEGFREYFWEHGILDSSDVYMMVLRKADHLHIGNCSFQGIQEEIIEIGLDIDIPFQNQGIGTDVLKMLVDYLRTHHAGQRIQMKTKSTNLPCRKMIEKAGGRKIGEEPTEIEQFIKRMIPKLEEDGLEEKADWSKEMLSRIESIRVYIYELDHE